MNTAIRRIRSEIAEIADSIASMNATAVRIGEASEWTDPRLPLIDADIRAWAWRRATLVMMVRVIEATAAERLQRLVSPPAACPACVAEAGEQWPAGTTSRSCDRHLSELRQAVAARHSTAA